MFPITRFANVFKLGSEQNYRTAINWRLKAHDDRGITETEHFGRVLSVFVRRQLRKIVFYRDIVSLTCSLHEIRFTDSLRRVAAFHVTMGKIFASVVWVEKEEKVLRPREEILCREFRQRGFSGLRLQIRFRAATPRAQPSSPSPELFTDETRLRPPKPLSTLSRLKLHHSPRSSFGFEKLCKQINRSMNAKWRRGGCGWTEKLSSCITQESLLTLPYTHLEFQFHSFSRLFYLDDLYGCKAAHESAIDKCRATKGGRKVAVCDNTSREGSRTGITRF